MNKCLARLIWKKEREGLIKSEMKKDTTVVSYNLLHLNTHAKKWTNIPQMNNNIPQNDNLKEMDKFSEMYNHKMNRRNRKKRIDQLMCNKIKSGNLNSQQTKV